MYRSRNFSPAKLGDQKSTLNQTMDSNKNNKFFGKNLLKYENRTIIIPEVDEVNAKYVNYKTESYSPAADTLTVTPACSANVKDRIPLIENRGCLTYQSSLSSLDSIKDNCSPINIPTPYF